MDTRLYFILGDLGGNVLVGALAGWLCCLFVGVGWNMPAAMMLAMAVGMVVGLVLWLPLGVLFGAMEVMLPVMFSGMFSGMVVGMWAAMEPLSAVDALVFGGLCGLGCILLVWLLNHVLRGRRAVGE